MASWPLNHEFVTRGGRLCARLLVRHWRTLRPRTAPLHTREPQKVLSLSQPATGGSRPHGAHSRLHTLTDVRALLFAARREQSARAVHESRTRRAAVPRSSVISLVHPTHIQTRGVRHRRASAPHDAWCRPDVCADFPRLLALPSHLSLPDKQTAPLAAGELSRAPRSASRRTLHVLVCPHKRRPRAPLSLGLRSWLVRMPNSEVRRLNSSISVFRRNSRIFRRRVTIAVSPRSEA